MLRASFIILLLLIPAIARAQTPDMTTICVPNGKPCSAANGNIAGGGGGGGSGGTPAPGLAVAPPPINGFGNLAATSSSVLLSTVIPGPNSAPWPATPQLVTILNDVASADTVYLCPFGGTCSSAVGLELTAGRAWQFTRPLTAMTVFAVSTATVQVTW